MTEALLPQAMTEAAAQVLPFERTVLVLQGGGALGAYQAGAFAALAETGIHLDWVCGISIGAINAALIVGNEPDRRIRRLRQFWEAITEPPVAFPTAPWFADLPWGNSEAVRAWTNRIRAATNLLYGAPNFFAPRPMPPLSLPTDNPAGASYYDTSPLRATLQKFIDFDLINRIPMRLSVGAANVHSGEPIYFSNDERRINVAHIMASSSVPPNFPPIEVEGQYYWDGGLVSNSAIQFVASSRPRYTALVFQVDLWDPVGELPLDVTAANLRAMEIHGASRINVSFEQFRAEQRFRRAVDKILKMVPEARRNDPEVKLVADEAHVQMATIVRLRYRAKEYEGASKIYDFSRRAMEEHWQAGYDDTKATLREPDLFAPPDLANPARIFDVHRGWEF